MPAQVYTFQGPYYGFTSMMTPKGTAFAFYNGFIQTTSKEVADYLKTDEFVEAGVKELSADDLKKITVPVASKRGRDFSAPSAQTEIDISSTISPAALLQRAVASTAHTPQSAASNSGTPASSVPTK